MEVEIANCIRTLRLKVKPEAYAWLNAAAVEITLGEKDVERGLKRVEAVWQPAPRPTARPVLTAR